MESGEGFDELLLAKNRCGHGRKVVSKRKNDPSLAGNLKENKNLGPSTPAMQMCTDGDAYPESFIRALTRENLDILNFIPLLTKSLGTQASFKLTK